MILTAYIESLTVVMGEAATTVHPKVRAVWNTLDGNLQVVDAGSSHTTTTGTSSAELIPVASSATIGTDPYRIRRVTGIASTNEDSVSRTFRFSVTRSGNTVLVYSATVPTGGTIMYAPAWGWKVYNAAGSLL